LANDDDHKRELNPHAWCYMLSQQNIIRYQSSTPGTALTADRSFFSYVLRSAMADASASDAPAFPLRNVADEIDMSTAPPARTMMTEAFERMCSEHLAQGQESVSGPGSSIRQTVEIRQRLPLLLQELGTRVLLDAPCGDFHWLSKVRLGVDTY